ncbi:MAG: PepSY-associated TM helix domain-containing protein [Bacteroidota bacterium]
MAHKRHKTNDPKQIGIKKIFRYIHLWLGLAASLVICVSMLGAAVFVWEEDLTDMYYSELVFADTVGLERLPPSRLFTAVKEKYPDRIWTFLEAKSTDGRNTIIRAYKTAENPGWLWTSGIEYYDMAYVNPYTGRVAGYIDRKNDWISLARFLHQNLLLKSSIGREIIAASALIMIFQALSGLYLWWPKKRKALKQRLTIRWKAHFKRLNWDFHSIGGFYTYLFMIFFAATGLTWSYQWWASGMFALMGSSKEEAFQKPAPPEITVCDFDLPMDIAYSNLVSRRPDWKEMYFAIPQPSRENGIIYTEAYYDDSSTGWQAMDHYTYNPNDGSLHHSLTQDQKLLAEKWRHSNYALHVGSIYGLPSKIIAFICALFFATLPISGFLIYWNRNSKSRKAKKRKKVLTA